MAFVVELEYDSPDVISLPRVRKQLQLEDDFVEDDELLRDYIDAAIVEAENYINSEITEKKYQITGKSIADVLTFKRQKITKIDSFEYRNESGDVVQISSDDYSLQNADNFANEIVFNDGFVLPSVKENTVNAVTLKVTVGYPSGKVPKAIQKALLLMVTDSYENRTDTVKEKVTASENALHPYKRYC